MAANDTFRDVPAGDEGAWETFGSHDMIEALGVIAELRYAAISSRPELRGPLDRILKGMESELRALAQRTAQIADDAIRLRIRLTQHRPPSNRSVHLIDLIHSEAMPFGSVRVALISELNKAINDNGSFGPYWRAQEEGSQAVGNIMSGRVIFGSFTGPAGDEVPKAAYGGAQKITTEGSQFIMGATPGGFGTIHHEIEGRHFLRDGAETAASEYGAGIHDISRRYAEQILALMRR